MIEHDRMIDRQKIDEINNLQNKICQIIYQLKLNSIKLKVNIVYRAL